MGVCSVVQSCPILRDPIDLSSPGSSVHGFSQARILEQVFMASSMGSSSPGDRTHISYASWICPHVLFLFFFFSFFFFKRSKIIFIYRQHSVQLFRKSVGTYFFPFIFISWRLITLQYCSGFCHTLTWISHGFTCVAHVFFTTSAT